MSWELSSQSSGWELTSQQSRGVCCENWRVSSTSQPGNQTTLQEVEWLCVSARKHIRNLTSRKLGWIRKSPGHLCSGKKQESGGQWALRAWGSKQAKAKIQEVWEGKIIVPIHQNTEKSPILKAEIVRANVSFNYSPRRHMVLRLQRWAGQGAWFNGISLPSFKFSGFIS